MIGPLVAIPFSGDVADFVDLFVQRLQLLVSAAEIFTSTRIFCDPRTRDLQDFPNLGAVYTPFFARYETYGSPCRCHLSAPTPICQRRHLNLKDGGNLPYQIIQRELLARFFWALRLLPELFNEIPAPEHPLVPCLTPMCSRQ